MTKKFAATLCACLVCQSSVCFAAEFVSVFSSYRMHPPTGDCGGHTLTIVRDFQSRRLIRGDLQTYEGNCEDSKVPINNVKFDSIKGTLSFVAPTYAQDGKGGLMIIGERRFVGVIEKNRVKGKIQYCPTSDSCISSEKVNLPAVANGSP